MTDNFNIDQLGERYAKLFETAEIAKFSPAERRDYEESMKNFRDLYASLETKYNKGHKDGFAEAEAEAHLKALQSAFTFFLIGHNVSRAD